MLNGAKNDVWTHKMQRDGSVWAVAGIEEYTSIWRECTTMLDMRLSARNAVGSRKPTGMVNTSRTLAHTYFNLTIARRSGIIDAKSQISEKPVRTEHEQGYNLNQHHFDGPREGPVMQVSMSWRMARFRRLHLQHKCCISLSRALADMEVSQFSHHIVRLVWSSSRIY